MPSDPDPRLLARMWPNRAHESNWIKDVLCSLGLHRWHTIPLPGVPPGVEYRFCRWCPEIRARQARR